MTSVHGEHERRRSAERIVAADLRVCCAGVEPARSVWIRPSVEQDLHHFQRGGRRARLASRSADLETRPLPFVRPWSVVKIVEVLFFPTIPPPRGRELAQSARVCVMMSVGVGRGGEL